MTASDINHLVAASRDHSAAISNQVETLAPDEPDRVGADFRVSGGRIWKFHRDRIDAWLNEKR